MMSPAASPEMAFQIRLRDGTALTVDTIATGNKNKLAEYKMAGLILKSLPESFGEPEEPQALDRHYELLQSPCLANFIEVATDTAIRKAHNYYKLCGFPVLSEDASLYASAAPAQTGIHIKMWVKDQIGRDGLDPDAGLKKLIQLVDLHGNRSAYAIACLAISNGTSAQVWYAVVEGEIASSLSGTLGFGWDKLFAPYLPEQYKDLQGATWADLGSERKQVMTPFRSEAASCLLQARL